MKLRAVAPVCLGLFLGLAVESQCSAASEPSGSSNAGAYEVDRRGWTASSDQSTLQVPATAQASWRQFVARHPGWTSRWNTRLATPVRSAGPPVELESRPFTSQQAGDAIRTFFVRELGVQSEDLQLLRAVGDRNGWWVQYTQSYRGLRVVGGRAYARVSAQGTVPLFGLDLRPHVDADITPLLTEAAARRAAYDDFPPDAGHTVRSAELVVLPVLANGHAAYRTAYEVNFTTREPFGAWMAYVDARSGEVLWRRSILESIDVTGAVSAAVESVTVGNPLQARTLPHLSVSLSDTALKTITGADGSFLLSAPTGGNDTLRARLAGPFAYVDNYSFGHETPSLAIPFDPDSTTVVPVLFDESNSRVQDRDAFYSAMRARDYIRQVDPGFSLLDYPMYLRVDIPNLQCNAFWDGHGLTFFAAGNQCVDMARIASVVVHEYGHGITDFQYRPFFPSAAMHEGFSDYFSATLLNDSRIGLGFFGPGTVLRSVDNQLRYPDNVSNDPHLTGLIIAGALWDLRKTLGAGPTDHLWHFARNGFSDNFDDYFFDLLVTDDDDGNVYNGTPDFDAIVNAFQKHGIGDYGIHVVHEPIRDTENPNQSFSIMASFLSVFAIVDTSVTVHLSIDHGSGPATESRMLLPTGGVREYATVLEQQPDETVVGYWFTARDTAGTVVTYPPAGASNPFHFRIGTDTTPPVIVHVPLADQPVDAPGITLHARVTDNLDKGVDSVRVTYTRDDGPEASMTLPAGGEGIFQGRLSLPSLQVGQTIRYRIQVADSAAIPNVSSFPDTGWIAFNIVRGFGRDFEDSDGGLTSQNGWTWGSPEPLVHPYSGTKVWGTSLGHPYGEDALESLIVGPVDLGNFTTAGLYFHHYYDTEEFFDGGAVYASTDSGTTWQLLVPDGEYPFPLVSSLGAPGFSGRAPEWTAAAFALNEYVGTSDLLLKFEFASDEAAGGLGWFVDDLEVVERQVLSRPRALTAASGQNGQVTLAWSPPAGVDPSAPNTPLLGYYVYRGLSGEAPVRITALPVPGPEYIDTTPTNGVFYLYSVRASYADGESAPTPPVEAIPYVAMFSGNTGPVVVNATPGQPVNTTIHFANAGTGFLKVNTWPTDPGRALEDARIRYTIHLGGGFLGSATAAHSVPDWETVTKTPKAIVPPGEWQLVYRDPEDNADGNVPDIDSVEVQVGSDSFYLRITGHGPWGPLTTWNLRASLDTDLDPATNPLGDYSIVAGAQVLNFLGIPAALLNGQGGLAGPVHHVAFPAPNVMEFGVFLGSIEFPDELFLNLKTFDASVSAVLDTAPDALPLSWLGVDEHRVVLFQGGEQDLHLHLSALPEGDYEGQLLLETNDPVRPVITIPLTYHVGNAVPVDLLSFQGHAEDLGVRLEWTASDAGDLLGFKVLRSERPGGAEVTLTPDALAEKNGAYVFEDRNVVDGHDYQYRLMEVSRNGDSRFHGPVAVHYAGMSAFTSVVLRASMPNPMQTTASIRFGLPEDSDVTLRLYSIDGRMVRELANRVHYPRGFHELTWDGRDGEGRLVSSGVFPFLLDAGHSKRKGKITVLR
jgi:Zn-dependent metalloprotease